MNNSCLNATHMRSLTQALVSQQKAVIESIPQFKAMMPDIQKVHLMVEAVEKCEVLRAKEDELAQTLAELDAQHDLCLRTFWRLMLTYTTLVVCKDESEQALSTQIQGTLDHALPDGQRYILMSFQGKAANATALLDRLTPEQKSLLQTIVADDLSAMDLAEQLHLIGSEMLEVLTKKSNITGEIESIDANQARAEWSRVINTLEQLAKLDSVPQDKAELILRPIRKAIEAQERRNQQRKAYANAQADEEAATSDTTGAEIHELETQSMAS